MYEHRKFHMRSKTVLDSGRHDRMWKTFRILQLLWLLCHCIAISYGYWRWACGKEPIIIILWKYIRRMVDFDGSLFVLVSTLKRSKYAYMLIQNPFIGHFICHIEISTEKKNIHINDFYSVATRRQKSSLKLSKWLFEQMRMAQANGTLSI